MNEEGRRRLVDALVAVFLNRPQDLDIIVAEYVKVTVKIPRPASLEDLASKAVAIANELGEAMLESLARRARRARRERPELASVVGALWPFAGDLTFTRIDSLRDLLAASPDTVRQVRARVTALGLLGEIPLWGKQGADELGDLLEGLAQRSGDPLPLLQVAGKLADHGGGATLDEWLAAGAPAPAASNAALVREARRLLVVLRHVENDDHVGEVWVCDHAGRPSFVTDLPRGTLAEMPQRFLAALVEEGPLLDTVSASELDHIEVVLPVGAMLTVVENWPLLGVDPIGADFSVSVRPLERGNPARYPAFLQGHVLVKKARKALDAAPAKRWIELDRVDEELKHHPDAWCVAEFCCLDASRAERTKALERLINKGVAAMLAPRQGGKATTIPPGPALPALVRAHRKTSPDQPVMLLWDADDLKLERKP